jgi:hypothetical protein
MTPVSAVPNGEPVIHQRRFILPSERKKTLGRANMRTKPVTASVARAEFMG